MSIYNFEKVWTPELAKEHPSSSGLLSGHALSAETITNFTTVNLYSIVATSTYGRSCVDHLHAVVKKILDYCVAMEEQSFRQNFYAVSDVDFFVQNLYHKYESRVDIDSITGARPAFSEFAKDTILTASGRIQEIFKLI